MFITVYYVAGLGHGYDCDDYNVEFTSVHQSLEEAVASAIKVVSQPDTKIVKTEVYREGLPSDAAFLRQVRNERRRQLKLPALRY